MNPAFLTTISVLSTEAAIAISLLTITKFLRQPDPKKYQETWLKFGILAALIVVLLVADLLGVWGLVPVISLLAYLAWRELLQGVQQQDEILLLSILGTLAGLSGFGQTPSNIFAGIIISAWSAIVLPIVMYRRPLELRQTLAIAFGMILISLPIALLLNLGLTAPSAFLFITLIVMTHDGFSETCGRLVGKTPLCPEISPNKTIEGASGGILFSLGTAYLLKFLLPDWQIWQVLIVAAAIALLSLSGDLLFSSLKREMGIKDFSRVLGVTGGVLDKFDGLLFSAPIFYVMFHYNWGM